MASETPRLDPREISQTHVPVFRLIAQIKSKSSDSILILNSPTVENEMITLDNVRVSSTSINFEIDSWYEFVCRSSDDGETGFLVLDAVPCKLQEGENISINGIVQLQNLSKKFPEIY
ncbi:hypothetical protein KAFR_0F01740 [Kazachstania africana CBS 2517]|uniref:Replication factor A protein 3 n=1 Tax=Kazachstania africana (strain ATCC 22294 / BCRC 22015 / CBS 2517 / CECT 1963 / NBRC 1671 / NRRL Y-8276) TaxID=1071382 RepID=H2AWM1_KAZAF|nr:hypothetical protein KAFR_0F01740 [Kazachstania africana CBS 2517]CCF58771.1 hypothetical protein KAFR_0F01740 [Kazachstania africana CBS 2517]